MNAQQLKNAILQEAIEGRLVPQDPNDEPASALLERIRKEKEELVKAGKLKKKDLEVKPISEDEIPFEIPESWEWVRFFSVYNMETNLVSPQLYLTYNHIAPDNIEKGTGRLLHCNTVKEDKVKSNNHLFYEGQIIYSKIRPLLRKAIIAPFDGLCSADMYPLSTEMHSKYALLYLLSDTFNKQVSAICSSRVKMPKINQEELSTILVPLPPLAEQHRIVAKIEELLPKVEEYGKAQNALNKLNAELPERLKKSILQEAISGRLVPQDPNDEPASVLHAQIRKEKEQLVKAGKLKKKDLIETLISEDEIPFEIPESWEWVRFGTITINRDSERIPLSVDERSRLEKKYDYYGASGVIDKVDRYLFNKPLLLIGEDGANLINRSTPIAFIARGEYWVNNHAHVLDYLNEDLMQYMCWYINAISLVDYVTGTAQPKMNQEKMNSILVALPPLAEQHRIVEKLEQLLGEIDKLKK